MKKPNQIERKSSSRAGDRQSESTSRVATDIAISKRRFEVLYQVAREVKADARKIGENAIESYLDFIEKFPYLAEAQPRFVHGEAIFAVLPTGKLYDRLDEACAIYDLNRNAVVDSAIGAYLDMVLRHEEPTMRENILSYRGSSDPENIAFILSLVDGSARTMFDSLVAQISSRPFAEACNEFNGLRELMMHHPGLSRERHALEMIVEGFGRL